MRLGFSGGHINIGATTTKAGPGCVAQARKIVTNRDWFDSCGFATPAILEILPDRYEMETIHGADAISFMHESGPAASIELLEMLVGLVASGLNAAEMRLVDLDVIHTKVHSVHQAIAGNPYVNEARALELEKIIGHRLDEMGDIFMPMHVCHGDLTLSNLLVPARGRPVLIDSIPVFLESPILDAAKLLQDARHGWTLRIYDAAVDTGRMRILMHSLEDMVMALPIDPLVLQFFSALNLLRILPYVREEMWITQYLLMELQSYG